MTDGLEGEAAKRTRGKQLFTFLGYPAEQFWAQMAFGQIAMRIDGWQTLAQATTGQPIDRAA